MFDLFFFDELHPSVVYYALSGLIYLTAEDAKGREGIGDSMGVIYGWCITFDGLYPSLVYYAIQGFWVIIEIG